MDHIYNNATREITLEKRTSSAEYMQPTQQTWQIFYSTGGKGTTWEGGHRVPYIVYWPGTVPSGISNELVTAMDIIATAVDLAGVSLPDDRVYDGRSIRDVIINGNHSPHEAFFYYCGSKMMAIRLGRYKAHFWTQRTLTRAEAGQACTDGVPQEYTAECGSCEGECVTEHNPPLLFDLFRDPGEAFPLTVSFYQDVMEDIQRAVDTHKEALVTGPPLIGEGTPLVIPCCDRATNCTCNYVHEPEIESCYRLH